MRNQISQITIQNDSRKFRLEKVTRSNTDIITFCESILQNYFQCFFAVSGDRLNDRITKWTFGGGQIFGGKKSRRQCKNAQRGKNFTVK